jgi:CRP-like cAMP-binding protein
VPHAVFRQTGSKSLMEAARPYSRLLYWLERSCAMSSDDRQRIAELPLTVANFGSNQLIAKHGDAPSRCTLLLSGFIYGHKLVGTSRRQITSLLVPGDIAGLQGLCLSRLDHSLSALGPTVVVFFPHAPFAAILDESPRLSRAFWRETFVEAAIAREWIANLGRREALARLAHVICELAVRLRVVDTLQSFSLCIPWTQTDVADICGISGVHANRVVQELRRSRVLDWRSSQICVLDWKALCEVADFSEDYLIRAPQQEFANSDA